MNAPPLVEVRDLNIRHLRRGGWLRRAVEVDALRDVSFRLQRGEALAVVGESGSGKSTLARALLRLHRPANGQVLLEGLDLAILSAAELRAERRRSRWFADPWPRSIVQTCRGGAEPLSIAATSSRERDDAARPPAQTRGSGRRGIFDAFPAPFRRQAQRVAIARTLICNPSALIAMTRCQPWMRLRAPILDCSRQRKERIWLRSYATSRGSAYICERTRRMRGKRGEGDTETFFTSIGIPYAAAAIEFDAAAHRGND